MIKDVNAKVCNKLDFDHDTLHGVDVWLIPHLMAGIAKVQVPEVLAGIARMVQLTNSCARLDARVPEALYLSLEHVLRVGQARHMVSTQGPRNPVPWSSGQYRRGSVKEGMNFSLTLGYTRLLLFLVSALANTPGTIR